MFNLLLHTDTNKRVRKQNKLTKKQNRLIKEQNAVMKRNSTKSNNIDIFDMCATAVGYVSSSYEERQKDEALRKAFDSEIERMDSEINELEKQKNDNSDIISPDDLFDM